MNVIFAFALLAVVALLGALNAKEPQAVEKQPQEVSTVGISTGSGDPS